MLDPCISSEHIRQLFIKMSNNCIIFTYLGDFAIGIWPLFMTLDDDFQKTDERDPACFICVKFI